MVNNKNNTIARQNYVPFLAETSLTLFLWAQPPQPETILADPDPYTMFGSRFSLDS